MENDLNQFFIVCSQKLKEVENKKKMPPYRSSLPVYNTSAIGHISTCSVLESNNTAGACLSISSVVILLLAISAYALMTAITGIIALASGHSFDGQEMSGFKGIAEYCGDNLRNMVLAYIIIALLVFGSTVKNASKKENAVAAGAGTFILYGIMASIITAFYAQSNHGTCQAYMDATKTSINTPYYVVVNQIVLGWVAAFLGLAIAIIFGPCSD